MEVYKHSTKDDITATQNDLQSDFLPSDTWGSIEVPITPREAEKIFVAAICSDDAAKEQAEFEKLTRLFPDKYGHPAPAGTGIVEYSVFPTDAGTKILFVTTFAQKPVKTILSKKSLGKGAIVHTAKIRNRFEPTSWKKTSWYFVAHALITGNENAFATVSKYH